MLLMNHVNNNVDNNFIKVSININGMYNFTNHLFL